MFDLIKYCMNKSKGGSGGESGNNQIGAGVAVAGILVGLGLMPDSAQPEVFSNLVDTVTQALNDAGKLGADLTMTLLNPREGIYYVQRDIVQAVFDVCAATSAIRPPFLSGISTSISYSAGYIPRDYSAERVFTFKDFSSPIYRWRFVEDNGNSYLIIHYFASVSPFTVAASNSYFSSYLDDFGCHIVSITEGAYKSQVFDFSSFSIPSGMTYGQFVASQTNGNTSVSVSDGLVAGDVIAAPGSAVSDAYPDWGNSEISSDDPDGNVNVPWWVLSVPASIAAADALTQSDVWQGLGNLKPGTSSENKNSSPILWWVKTK